MTTSNTKPTPLDPQALSAEELRRALDYDPDTGDFVWRPRPRDQFQADHAFERFNADRAGKKAGKAYPAGAVVCYRLVKFPAAQLAWLHAYGSWPKRDLEFVDGDPTNNALANLVEGDLPFVVGCNGPAHQRRTAGGKRGRKAAAPPVAKVEGGVDDWHAERRLKIEAERVRMAAERAALLGRDGSDLV